MAMTFVKIIKVEKSFKGKSIGEFTYSDWILSTNLSLNDGEWILSVEIFNQGQSSVFQYSPVWLYVHTCHGWLHLRLVSWGKAQILYYGVIGDHLSVSQ